MEPFENMVGKGENDGKHIVFYSIKDKVGHFRHFFPLLLDMLLIWTLLKFGHVGKSYFKEVQICEKQHTKKKVLQP